MGTNHCIRVEYLSAYVFMHSSYVNYITERCVAPVSAKVLRVWDLDMNFCRHGSSLSQVISLQI